MIQSVIQNFCSKWQLLRRIWSFQMTVWLIASVLQVSLLQKSLIICGVTCLTQKFWMRSWRLRVVWNHCFVQMQWQLLVWIWASIKDLLFLCLYCEMTQSLCQLHHCLHMKHKCLIMHSGMTASLQKWNLCSQWKQSHNNSKSCVLRNKWTVLARRNLQGRLTRKFTGFCTCITLGASSEIADQIYQLSLLTLITFILSQNLQFVMESPVSSLRLGRSMETNFHPRHGTRWSFVCKCILNLWVSFGNFWMTWQMFYHIEIHCW